MPAFFGENPTWLSFETKVKKINLNFVSGTDIKAVKEVL